LRSKSPRRRSRAAHSLGEMGPRAAPAVPFLIELLDDREVAKSFEDAVTALGAIQDWRAIEPLIEELKRTPPDPWAAEALFEITGERLGEDPQKWRAWWDQKKATYEASPTSDSP
jgi:HEAT repeat protein